MTEVYQVIAAGGDVGTFVAAVAILWHGKRLARIERYLWPEVFGND